VGTQFAGKQVGNTLFLPSKVNIRRPSRGAAHSGRPLHMADLRIAYEILYGTNREAGPVADSSPIRSGFAPKVNGGPEINPPTCLPLNESARDSSALHESVTAKRESA
jgi:hypothetical protein